MRSVPVECLGCGSVRVATLIRGHVEAHECPRCGYLGWALSAELSEPTRRLLRERPVDRRRLRVSLVA